MSIKDVFRSLKPSERETLMCAFNEGIPKHIELGDGSFIGVNVEYIQFLKPIETRGQWAIGKVKTQCQ